MFSQPPRPHLHPPPYAGQARRGGCARLSAFHHGSYRQGFRPLGATPGQASWDVAGRSIRYGRPNRGAKISRSDAGVTRARLSQSRECTSRTGHSAGQHDARSCPGAECIVPPAGTALAPLSEYLRPKASFTERDSLSAYLKWRQKSTAKSLLWRRRLCTGGVIVWKNSSFSYIPLVVFDVSFNRLINLAA